MEKLVCILVCLNVSQSFQAKVQNKLKNFGEIITKNIIQK